MPQWQHVPLKVPLFSVEELPIKEPAPLATYSIGEEISSSVPLAIAWSPPGLAKHRRCALAALTGNLVLSIWSAEGKPQEEASWNRRLVVNNALARYFLNTSSDEQRHTGSDLGEKLRLRTRIRAFAWAPAFPGSDSTGIIGTRLSYGQHIVAVSNDDNQVAFILIDSPTSTLGVGQSWGAEVLAHFSLTPNSENFFSEPAIFEDMISQQRQILHVSWSPWIVQGDSYRSVLVYATNNDVRARVVTYTTSSIGLGDEVIYPEIEVRYTGLMKWSPSIQTGGTLKLAIFSTSGLVCMTILIDDASIKERVTHNLDGRWDQITGAIWESSHHSTLRLHFSSLLSTLENPTAVLDASSGGLKTLPSPSWRDQIENNLVLFSVKNDLKGNSKAKVWGLTISPLEDFIVAYNSVHPSDMIEYGPPADRRGTIAISTLRQYSQLRVAFPRRSVSSEGVLYTIKKLAENTVEDTDQLPAFAQEVLEKLMQAYAPLSKPRWDNRNPATCVEPKNLPSLVRYFKQVAFFNPNTMRDRYTTLVSQACNTTSSKDIGRALIAYRLANALKELPSILSQSSFSAEILAQHRQLIVLINGITRPETRDMEPLSENDIENHRNDLHDDLVTTIDQIAPGLVLATDTCDFCSAPIHFTDFTSAVCTNGHQFPRCGLSLLAIQAPGITKYCGLCSTPYLSEGFVAAQEIETRPESGSGVDSVVEKSSATKISAHEVQNLGVHLQTDGEEEIRSPAIQVNDDATGRMTIEEEQMELPVTLARVLFLACDVCIYCGGKFVD